MANDSDDKGALFLPGWLGWHSPSLWPATALHLFCPQ